MPRGVLRDPGGRLSRIRTVGAPHGLGVARNGKGKCRSGTVVRRGPETTMMTLDTRAADGKADSHTAALGRVKRFEQSVRVLRLEAHPGILHAKAHAIA